MAVWVGGWVGAWAEACELRVVVVLQCGEWAWAAPSYSLRSCPLHPPLALAPSGLLGLVVVPCPSCSTHPPTHGPIHTTPTGSVHR